jgi:regulator of sirC expression with transglutaminase-like and TPR domain
MAPSKLPVCCSPAAFGLLAKVSGTGSIDSPGALLTGAVAISMHEMEDVDPSGAEAMVQGYADAVRSRVRGRQPQALLAHLHDVLFEEEGFRGNTQDYYASGNSYVPAVLETKRGLPITLSLIYKLVAERLGLKAWGVGLPGHFLVGVEAGDATGEDGKPATMLVDPFNGGRILTPDEAHDRIQEMFGPEAEWSEEMLRPASNRHWLTRILQNLLNVFGSANQFADVAAVLEMEMLLWPNHHHLQRDLGLVPARCGMSRPASMWLDRYLRSNPDDPQKSQLKELLQVLST